MIRDFVFYLFPHSRTALTFHSCRTWDFNEMSADTVLVLFMLLFILLSAGWLLSLVRPRACLLWFNILSVIIVFYILHRNPSITCTAITTITSFNDNHNFGCTAGTARTTEDGYYMCNWMAKILNWNAWRHAIPFTVSWRDKIEIQWMCAECATAAE